jgi:hypothetical protein
MSDQPLRTTMNAMSEPSGKAPSAPKTPAGQRVANRVVRGLLRTPLISLGMGNRLVTLYILGRKSGRRYSIPVAYTKQGGDMLIGTPFGWGRNLRTGEPLEIRLKGKRRVADVVVYTAEDDVVRVYELMTRDNKVFANFNKVGYDADGNPRPADLHRAWADGARAFRLTPR